MSEEARIPDWSEIWENDVVKIAAGMAGIYALFIFFGALLGYSLNSFANMLRLATFFIAVYALSVLALNLQWGYTGLFNIGIAGFWAVGAYTMAMLTKSPTAPIPGLGLPLWVGVVGGMIAAALAGLIAALPALRLRADYLAITTIGLSEIIRYTYKLDTFSEFTIFGVTVGTGGGGGISLSTYPGSAVREFVLSTFGNTLVESLVALGIQKSVVVGWAYVLFIVAIVAVVYVLLMRIGFSPFGRVLKAIREDEDVARALGKNTNLFKIKSFMVGCALMGLVGMLWQARTGVIDPFRFRPIFTFYVWIALIIGGSGSNTGSILGAILFAGLFLKAPRVLATIVRKLLGITSTPETFADAIVALASLDVKPIVAYTVSNIGPLRFVAIGVVLIWLMQHRPEGLLGHRTEMAASIDLRDSGERQRATATDGGDTNE